MKNSIRFDLSDWLIHFFRPVDTNVESEIYGFEDMGFSNFSEVDKYPAIFMLRCALRLGRLWATWSYRKGVRTIYGKYPAVCFTEMPIAAFLESGKIREAKGEAMSQFALVFPKIDMFKVGANSVIYGLTNKGYWLPSGENGRARLMNSAVLPEIEQYRYVSYNPSLKRPIDWSHEREWRWPYREDIISDKDNLERPELRNGISMPGFNFYEYSIKGMGVVVKTKEQAKWVIHDILVLIDRGVITNDQFNFVLVSDDLPSISGLISPVGISEAISNSLVDLKPFFSHEESVLIHHVEIFSKIVFEIEKNSETPIEGEFGGCWLWILDNTSILTRALLYDGRVIVSKSGKYLVHLFEFSDSRSLRER